jgi:nucleoside-diphosphate-sugar epimerase
MRVLITGSAGAVGTTLIKGMMDRHEIRGFDRVETPELDDAVIGEITDFDAVEKATRDMDAVIHLVNAGPEWEQALQSMTGTYNVFESAHRNRVRRVAFASRAGLLPQAYYPRTMQRTVELLPKPDSYYSITKSFGEDMGYMYSARFDMEVVSVRIGNFNRDRDLPTHPHQLSHGDCVRVFEQAITHPGIKFEVVFGVSDSDWPLYDLDHGRTVIGYYPQDQSVVPEKERK